MKRKALFFLIIVAVVSCDKANDMLIFEDAGIRILPADKTINVGESFTLVATFTDHSIKDKSVNWSSSDKSIAEVDKNGKVTAKNPGTVLIFVISNQNNKIATCSITVEKIEIKRALLHILSQPQHQSPKGKTPKTETPSGNSHQLIELVINKKS